jgi:formate dehydrogenase iron-sulfur subunit
MTELAIQKVDGGAQRMGFFTDTTVCIGCKACEVACKQWNDLPADGSQFEPGGSYDHTGELGAATWRHVRFIEQLEEEQAPKWVFMSDVCKHCTNAGCLDACPTGALIRTEFDTVVVQPDVCNGCGYCIPSCPFGVIDRDKIDGRAAKCTLCYDRLEDGLEPACAKSCPTDSIQFGPYDELVQVAERRVAALHDRGVEKAHLYGTDESLAGGLGAFFLLTEEPETYGLPARADSPIQEGAVQATVAAVSAGLLAAAGVAAAFMAGKAREPSGRARARALAKRRRW